MIRKLPSILLQEAAVLIPKLPLDVEDATHSKSESKVIRRLPGTFIVGTTNRSLILGPCWGAAVLIIKLPLDAEDAPQSKSEYEASTLSTAISAC